MSNQQLSTVEKSRTSALSAMASRFSVDPAKLLETLKATVFKGASDAEMMALCVVANEYRLNPLTKEIYAFPAKGGGIVPVVSVDGWIRIINEQPQMDGLEFEWENDKEGNLVSCTAIIYRKDRSRPIKVTEYLSECSRNTEPWKMKHRMLRHKALIQGGRVAFGFGGIYDEDEALDIKEAKAIEITKPVFSSTAKAIADTTPKKEEPTPKESTATKPEPEKKEEPRRATPQEGVQNLMAGSGVTEGQLCAYLTEQGEECAFVADISDTTAKGLIANWAQILGDIKAKTSQQTTARTDF